MEYLLFAAYLVLFAWLVTRVKFFTRTGLSKSQLMILFLLKVMAGILYGWIGIYYGGLAQMSDTWIYHSQGIQEYHLLKQHPSEYFTNLFRDPYEGGMAKFLGTEGSYWNDLKGNIFIKVLSLFDLLTFGNYYVNVIFYSFFSFAGPVALYRVMCDVFPGRRYIILAATFLVPSFLFWTSGLHKEGLIFTGLSFVIYIIYFSMRDRKMSFKRILILLFSLLMVLTLRNYIILILIPSLIAWLAATRKPRFNLAIFAGFYLFFGLIFFNARYLNPRLDFPQSVVNKQQEFMKLEGNSTIPITQLKPTAVSFLKNAPQAINLSSIRPYPSDVHHILSLASAIEVNGLLLVFLLFLFFQRNSIRSPSFVYFCVFFSFTFLLAIGFSVNNLGAIVRYRSIILPFVVVPMLALTDWPRLFRWVSKYINIKNNVTE